MANKTEAFFPEAFLLDYLGNYFASKFASVVIVAVFFLIAQQVVAFFMTSRSVRGYINKNTVLDQKGTNKVTVLATSRVIGFIHNAIQIPLALYTLSKSEMWENQVHKSSFSSNLTMLISSGFFLFDAIHCLASIKQEGPLYAFHACSCFIVYYYAYCYDIINFFGCVFLMWEASTPLIHLRWFLYKIGYTQTVLYGVVSTSAVFLFFAARIVWGYYATFLTFKATGQELRDHIPGYSMSVPIIYLMRTINIGLDVLNTYWFSLMINKIIKIVGGSSFHNVTGEKDE